LRQLLHIGIPELLEALLACCPPSLACRLALISNQWAAAAEMGLRKVCERHRWQLPRRPRLQRGAGSLGARLPWRACFVQRICRSCMECAGDFAVRGIDGGAPRFFLCRSCAKSGTVVERLQQTRATLDVTGLSGRPLYSKFQSRFCSEVSKLSRESIDNASGSRAQLRMQRGGSR